MAGVDYLAMVADPEELLNIAHSIDGPKIARLLGEYQQMVQTMNQVGQFGHDADNAAASQLFGKFVDEAHHESTVLSYAALNIADTCNRMKAKLSNFYEQFVEKVQPAAQTLQQVYDAQLGQGAVSSPAELRTASTALAKALGHLYTDLAGNPTINVEPTFPEAAIPNIGADGRRAPEGQSAAGGRGGSASSSGAPGGVASENTATSQPGSAPQAEAGQVEAAQAAVPAAGAVASGGAQQAAGAAQQGVVAAQGAASAAPGAKSKAADGASKAGDSASGGLADAAGGALGALGGVGSSLGSAAGGLAGALGSGVGIGADAAGLATSLGTLGVPAAAESTLASDPGEGLADDDLEKMSDPAKAATTHPTADIATGGSGSAPHPLSEPPSARIAPAPEFRATPVSASLPFEPTGAGAPAAGASSGMMGMPMMGGAGMHSANGEHRVASYLISKEQGERQFTAGLPLASEEILGDLDERERLAMQIASIDEPIEEIR